jgi:alkylation response protein AidB-like acyl-CoA dehydrogenase
MLHSRRLLRKLPAKSFCLTKPTLRSVSLLVNSQNLTDEQKMIQESAMSFAKTHLMPNAAEWDEKKHFPKDVIKEAADYGFAGIYVSEDVGGVGLGRIEASLIFEALSTGCVGTSAYISIHNMVAWMIDTYGNEEQRKRFIPEMTTFDKFSSYCLTEPNSGSDAIAMKSFAEDKGDHFLLNGSKAFISGAGESDLYLVMCKTGEKEVSCLVVEKDTKGLSFGKNEIKMGWNVQPTKAVTFEDWKIPKENLLGNRGDGFKFAMSGLDGGRVNIASCSLGGAAFCLETATQYIKTRKQFGKTLSNFQYLQFKLAQMATDLEASRLMVRNAANLMDQNHKDKTMYWAMAKHFATEKCYGVVNYALQMHGGYGYLREYPIERYLRDLRVHEILEGSSEVMQIITSRALLRD